MWIFIPIRDSNFLSSLEVKTIHKFLSKQEPTSGLLLQTNTGYQVYLSFEVFADTTSLHH